MDKMEDQIAISVIVSTYNRVKKLERAINSILKQTFKNYEIIIVDDASTDGTEKFCRKLVKKHPGVIRYFRRDTNWGKHGKPKNEGIKEARGVLISFLDDDNEYLIDHLQALFNEMIHNPLLDIVYGDRWLIDETNKRKKVKGICSDFNPILLKEQNYIDTSDVLIKKSVLLDVGGWDEFLPKFADWNLFVRLAKANKRFLRVPKILSNYYFHSGMNQLKTQTPVDPRTGRALPTFEPENCTIWANQETFGPAKKLRVALFTLTYDRLDYTKRMLESLKKFAGYEYDHFIIDNGSNDGTVEWLKKNKSKYSIKELVLNVENVGISKGSNQALDLIGQGYDVIMKIDNDCELETDGLIRDIVSVFERTRQLVISPNVEGLIDSAGGVPRYSDGYVNDLLLGFTKHLGGISTAAYKDVYRSFRWKEDDFLHGVQDMIFSQYCLKVGLYLCYLENHRVFHMDTTSGQKQKYPKYFERRKEEKIKKYTAV